MYFPGMSQYEARINAGVSLTFLAYGYQGKVGG